MHITIEPEDFSRTDFIKEGYCTPFEIIESSLTSWMHPFLPLMDLYPGSDRWRRIKDKSPATDVTKLTASSFKLKPLLPEVGVPNF